MINFLRVLAFTVILSPALSQDKKAEGILDAMSAKYKALKTFNANFTYGVEGAGGKLSNVFTGNVTVKGNKFKLKTAGQEIFNNGKEVYTFVKETNEVNISDYNANDDSDFSPSKIYTIYKKGYKYKFKEENAVAGVSYEVVELSPTNGKSNVKMIQITVNKKDKSIKNWKVWDKSGKKTVFRIDKFVPNVPAADAMFIFDKSKYPGVEVVDLR
ncbi:MAG: outer membrane lipoprotein carrier protein LolA [Cytophagaceae bacterium]|nr:outer membrane lipoprotein carrier protein LolA [Cytophagaceae bacterium]MBL0301825.1 outer membrane lipoprotein carrier protein LolA [Cytophagaceae bacterium]MBL0324651.1 outer membrane lipoprotein carrier protein LolA [Cytophagaceae bacterium]